MATASLISGDLLSRAAARRLAAIAFAAAVAAPSPAPSFVDLPGGSPGIGFDDLRFAHRIKRVLVPGGRSGTLFLVDPADESVAAIPGFTEKPDYGGGHDDSVTSADEGEGFLFASDRSARIVAIVDPARPAIVSRAALAAGPDYVRWCGKRQEVWVTEPDRERIEVFRFDRAERALRPVGLIRVPGGPESLAVDDAAGRAYTHLWAGETVAIDLASRAIVERWKNGCSGSRGIALDSRRGFLFAGCAEGRATVIDVRHGGRRLGDVAVGTGVDVIDYDPGLAHLYVPSGKAGTLSIVEVSAEGALRTLATRPTASGAHCGVSDLRGFVYVCDPRRGRLLVVRDAFPASAH
jgi:hypothetical protein